MSLESGHSTISKIKEIVADKSILIVEDDSTARIYIERIFSKLFAKTDAACNGAEALKLYQENQYDIVLTDITMPIMDGIELASKIRLLNTDQKIIVLSAHKENDKLLRLINIGITAFLEKPIDVEKIYKIIEKLHKE